MSGSREVLAVKRTMLEIYYVRNFAGHYICPPPAWKMHLWQ